MHLPQLPETEQVIRHGLSLGHAQQGLNSAVMLVLYDRGLASSSDGNMMHTSRSMGVFSVSGVEFQDSRKLNKNEATIVTFSLSVVGFGFLVHLSLGM